MVGHVRVAGEARVQVRGRQLEEGLDGKAGADIVCWFRGVGKEA